VGGWIRDIVQHPAGIVMLHEAPPEDQDTGNRTVINGVAQTGLNVARYQDGTTIVAKPLKMRGDVIEARSSAKIWCSRWMPTRVPT
jgi:hypothetical protein